MSAKYKTSGPNEHETWETYFAQLHRDSLELKAAKLDVIEK